MKSIIEYLKENYEVGYRKDGAPFCVGGAWMNVECGVESEEMDTTLLESAPGHPNGKNFREHLVRANPHLDDKVPTEGPMTYHDRGEEVLVATLLVDYIIYANDAGDIEGAWHALEMALMYPLNPYEDEVTGSSRELTAKAVE